MLFTAPPRHSQLLQHIQIRGLNIIEATCIKSTNGLFSSVIGRIRDSSGDSSGDSAGDLAEYSSVY